MPPDTMESEGEVELVDPSRAERPAAPRSDIDRAAGMLLAAERPVIYAGGGVHLSGCHDVLAAVAEYLQAGVVQSAEGKGAVSDTGDLSLGAALFPQSALRRHFEAADVILVVGSRLALAAPKPEAQVIQLDVDGAEIGRNHAKTFGLVGDARATLAELLERLRAAAPPRRSRKAEREALRVAIAASMTQEPNTSILKSLRAGTPEDAIVIAGMTQIGYYSRPFWPVYRPRTYLTSSYSGNLGYEYPTALGAKVAVPTRPVIAICGDGGFLYNSQELATAVLHRINVVAVVFNDNAYGNVARDLDESWGGSYAAELHNPDPAVLRAPARARQVQALTSVARASSSRRPGSALLRDASVVLAAAVGTAEPAADRAAHEALAVRAALQDAVDVHGGAHDDDERRDRPRRRHEPPE